MDLEQRLNLKIAIKTIGVHADRVLVKDVYNQYEAVALVSALELLLEEARSKRDSYKGNL